MLVVVNYKTTNRNFNYMNDVIERISKYENIYNESKSIINKLKLAYDEYIKILPSIKELEDYYVEGEWKSDYKLDELGEIPKELKRGILSEDTLYDFFEENDKIKEKIKI